MKTKPQIAIVGAGNLASALAVALRRAGYTIAVVIGRSSASSQRKVKKLAREVGASALSDFPVGLKADLVWLCVPDDAIRGVAESLPGRIDWKGRVALHSSGALASDELDALHRRGAAVGSVHPLMTFVAGSRPPLAGVPFAVEGDGAVLRIARKIVKDLGGRAYAISKDDKPAYHAWGTFVSPLVTALLATSEQMAAVAGVNPRAARKRMLPIVAQTVANYAALGAPAGFSGPLIRGDVETVRQHLRSLQAVPVLREVYRALAVSAVRYLPGKNKVGMRRLLTGK